jgi:hypothetical protein
VQPRPATGIARLHSERSAHVGVVRLIVGVCSVLAALGGPAAAQSAPAPAPPDLTAASAEAFLKDAGLQVCEISDGDAMVTRISGAVKSLSIGVATDCARYDKGNPTVVNVHQFADQQHRDAMVASLQELRFRALRPFGSVWVVDTFVVVLLGPQRQEVEGLLKAEYKRRHPDAG